MTDRARDEETIAWLLEGDAAVRWQTLRDLVGAEPDVVAAARARVPREGLGATVLAHQDADGVWRKDGEADWATTLVSLQVLRACDPDPADPLVAAALDRLDAGFRWHPSLGGKPFAEGETEPCINGNVLAIASAFGRPNAALATRLVGEQLADGGWNCEAPKSARGSFHSTICVLEGLLAYERATGDAGVREARLRGEAYLLERSLLRRRSTGAIIDPSFADLAFPPRYRFDALRALDHLRLAGARPDARTAEAAGIVAAKRDADGRWPLERTHGEVLAFELPERVGGASRWITLRAMRVEGWVMGYGWPSRSAGAATSGEAVPGGPVG